VSDQLISKYLSFADLPDPDLFIRTSGEQRISNFILWQLVYTELYFTDILWPDFNADELDKALSFFAARERRFGCTGEQMTHPHVIPAKVHRHQFSNSLPLQGEGKEGGV
jgi:undecaprenyl diphosphate synthase